MVVPVVTGMVTGHDEEAAAAASASLKLMESKEVISSCRACLCATAECLRLSRENTADLSAGDNGGDDVGDREKSRRVLVGEWEQNIQHRLFLLLNTDADDPPPPETKFSDGGRTLS